MRVSPVAAVAGLCLPLAACGSAGPNTSMPAAVRAAQALGAPASTVPPVPNPNGGVGSVPATMAAVHGRQVTAGGPCGAPDACFGIAVSNSGSGATFAFTDVQVVNGLIAGYRQNFPTGTTAAAAVSEVLHNLPSDATATPLTSIVGSTASCAFANVTSATLAALFPSSGQNGTFDSGGSATLGIELSTTTPQGFTVYRPSDVQQAQLRLGGDASSMAC